jgi:DNA-binding MarR family transcriptional regulator
LRSLERKGLIKRETDTADTRVRRVRATKMGARVAPQAIAIFEEVDAHFFADLPERETLRLLRYLARTPEDR